MNLKLFLGLIKDVVANLYDKADLETHPLTKYLDLPEGFMGSRGEYLQQLVIESIERMKPEGREFSPQSTEWRPYIILRRRYIEGIPPQLLAVQLSVSERQLRRDHSKALHALSGRLYDRLYPHSLADTSLEDEVDLQAQGFDLQRELIDLKEIVVGVVQTLQKRANDEKVGINVHLPDIAMPVMTDRIVLRQILISMLNSAFHLQANQEINLELIVENNSFLIATRFVLDDEWEWIYSDEKESSLEAALLWAEQINAKLTITPHACDQCDGELFRLTLSIPRAKRDICLVIDDQEPALRMFQRYLAQTNIDVIGARDPSQVLEITKKYLPRVISLDVMMPRMDGWEILQMLQADQVTQTIPVIVCSAWEEPELARSLGAAGFLKKPVTQKDLLDALARLGIDVK
jgi:CheY-like chemotaxis protein